MTRWIRLVGFALVVSVGSSWLGCWGMNHWLETVDLEEYSFASVRIIGDTGQIEVGAGTSSMLDADISYSGDEVPIIHIDLEGDVLVIDVECAGFLSLCGSDLSLVLPAETPLEVNTDSGPIYVTNMAATADLDTDTGAVNVDGHDGDLYIVGNTGSINLYDVRAAVVDISTDTGIIDAGAMDTEAFWADTETGTVTFEAQTPPADVQIITDTGSVSVRVPITDADALPVDYDLQISTDSGSLSTTMVEDSDAAWRVIAITTTTGSISVDGY